MFKMGFGLTGNKFDGFSLSKFYLRCRVGFLVFLQKVCKLFVVFELSLLHWHNLFDVLLEIFQVLHELLLLFLELVDFCAIFCNGTLAKIVVGDLNIFLIELQEIFSSLGLQGLERIFYRFSLGSKEHLDLNSLAKNGVTTEGHQKCLQEIHSL